MGNLLNMSGGSLLTKGGLLPSGYTQLEYIESTGTQYIDTGIYISDEPDEDINIEVCLKSNKMDDNHGFGADGALGIVSNHNSNLNWMFAAKDTKIPVSFDEFEVIRFFIENTIRYLEAKNTVVTYNAHVTMPGNFGLGVLFVRSKVYPSHSYKAKWKYVKAVKNNNVIEDLIPARRNSDNILGMYDTVTGNFLTNQGPDTFIAGPEV